MLDGSFDWEEKEGLVYHRGKIYIPDDFELRRDVIKSCHNTREAGHPGRSGTQELIARLYWWPRMAQNVADYVAGCDQCQRNKAAVHPPVRLTPLDVPEGPWQVIGQDLIVGLPKVKGYDVILVFADLYGKGVHLIPTTEKIDAEGVADIHYREIYRLHSIPERFVSDGGPQFNARVMRVLLKRLGIKTGITTAYHPQVDGQTEHKNKGVSTYLRMFVNKRQNDWVDLLPSAEFVLNSRVTSATGYSPFHLLYGYQPKFNIQPGPTTMIPEVDQCLQKMKEARTDAEAALRMSKQRMVDAYQTPRVKPKTFQEGDKVWLDAKYYHVKQPAKKLGPKRLGPFKVMERIGEHDYRLELPASYRLHPVFHHEKLSLCTETDEYGRYPEREPLEVDGELEYDVEKILDSKHDRRYKDGILYLVCWKGYDQGHDSWEPLANVKNSMELVEEFHKTHPSAPRKLSAIMFESLPWRPLENLTEVDPSPYSWTEGIREALPGRQRLEEGVM